MDVVPEDFLSTIMVGDKETIQRWLFSLMLLIIAAVTIFTLVSLKNIKFTFTSLYFPVTEFIHLISPYQKILVWTPWSLHFILIGFCYNSISFIYILKILFWEVVHMLHQNAKELHWHKKGEDVLYERIKGWQVFRNKMLPGAKMSLCPREGVARTQQTCKKDAQFAQRMVVGPICHPLLTSKFLFPENTVPSYAFRNNGCRGNRSKRTPVGCG